MNSRAIEPIELQAQLEHLTGRAGLDLDDEYEEVMMRAVMAFGQLGAKMLMFYCCYAKYMLRRAKAMIYRRKARPSTEKQRLSSIEEHPEEQLQDSSSTPSRGVWMGVVEHGNLIIPQPENRVSQRCGSIASLYRQQELQEILVVCELNFKAGRNVAERLSHPNSNQKLTEVDCISGLIEVFQLQSQPQQALQYAKSALAKAISIEPTNLPTRLPLLMCRLHCCVKRLTRQLLADGDQQTDFLVVHRLLQTLSLLEGRVEQVQKPSISSLSLLKMRCSVSSGDTPQVKNLKQALARILAGMYDEPILRSKSRNTIKHLGTLGNWQTTNPQLLH